MDWQGRFEENDRELSGLLKELSSYDQKVLHQSPGAGKWSVMQVLEHLYLSESLTLKYLQKKMSYQPDLPLASWRTALRRALLWIYVKIPIPFAAPKPVSTDKLGSSASLEELAEKYSGMRKEFRRFYEAQNPAFHKSAVYRHPISGLLDTKGTLLFFREHMRRHRKQIRKALRVLSR